MSAEESKPVKKEYKRFAIKTVTVKTIRSESVKHVLAASEDAARNGDIYQPEENGVSWSVTVNERGFSGELIALTETVEVTESK